MQLFIVGGAVRDRLLGEPVSDRDWVAVGSTPAELLALGYKPVGKDFPVFLHPHTGEEVALARTERKSGRGYHGFTFHAAPEVTLEQDLARRDLTINAIAEAADGTLIDPFGGQQDLARGVLRHVSPAFAEDPVRLLRLARFAARWPHFSVAPETHALLVRLVQEGEVDALVAERVWQELARGLMARQPSRMFEVLRGCGALARLLPEPTCDTKALAQVDAAATAGAELPVRFALLGWQGEAAVAKVAARLRVPTEVRELAQLFVREYGPVAAWLQQGGRPAAAAVPAPAPASASLAAQAENLLTLFERADALRRPERFAALLQACGLALEGNSVSGGSHAAAAGSRAHEPRARPATAAASTLVSLLEHVRRTDAAKAVNAAVAEGLCGALLGDVVHRARLAALTPALATAQTAWGGAPPNTSL